MNSYKYFDILAASFVAVLLLSNISSSAKIVDFGISVLGLPLAFDAGTLLFPLSYIFGDVLTEIYGYRKVRRVILLGFACSACASAYLWLVSVMPGEAMWQDYAGDEAYSAILGGMSSGGIIIASLCAYLIGELSNSFVFDRMKVWQKGRNLWMRTIGSTLVGQALDTTIFVVIACSFAVFPWEIALSLIVANYIFKVGIEVLFTPGTYAVVGWLRKKEQ